MNNNSFELIKEDHQQVVAIYDKVTNLNDIFYALGNEVFPKLQTGELGFVQQYKDICKILEPLQESVEISAMGEQFQKFTNELNNKLNNSKDKEIRQNIENILKTDNIFIYLNNHGKKHIDDILDRIISILVHFNYGYLTPYELFILLCAAQVHDIGIFYGREEHEQKIKNVLEQNCNNTIIDSSSRDLIYRIAKAHSGKICGDKDTIANKTSKLTKLECYRDGYKVRERMLAALLRFSDELADDCKRTNKHLLDEKKLGDSYIYHAYSYSLKSSYLEKREHSKIVDIILKYEVDKKLALKKIKKNNKSIFLIDEINNRVKKMELERIYCMKFLREYIQLGAIKVNIKIKDTNLNNIIYEFNYELDDFGYPTSITVPQNIMTGKDIKNKIK